ncbi:MAG: GntR family transcriptional regulator [Lentisphaerota bacterium]
MPLYIDIMNQLSAEITAGKYRPESSLPSERELCLRFNTSQKSIRNALFHLQEKGYIYKKRGSGSFVRQDSRRSSIINLGVAINYSPDRPAVNILSNPYFSQILKGVNRAAAENQANVSMFIYDETEEISERSFTGYRLDGLLNFQSTVSDALNKYLVEHGAKVVSTANSFQMDRYNGKYAHPCIVNDYLYGIEQALKFYLDNANKHFGFFANAIHGLSNYELYKKVFSRNNAKFDVKHTVIYPDTGDTSHFVRERAEYFARALFGSAIPDVIFSDGDFIVSEIIAFLLETKDGRNILDKVRFCTIGVPELTPKLKCDNNIDYVIPQNEKLGEEAALKLIEFIKNGSLPESRYYVPAVFVPATTDINTYNRLLKNKEALS